MHIAAGVALPFNVQHSPRNFLLSVESHNRIGGRDARILVLNDAIPKEIVKSRRMLWGRKQRLLQARALRLFRLHIRRFYRRFREIFQARGVRRKPCQLLSLCVLPACMDIILNKTIFWRQCRMQCMNGSKRTWN